jgi:hypothetical protein
MTPETARPAGNCGPPILGAALDHPLGRQYPRGDISAPLRRRQLGLTPPRRLAPGNRVFTPVDLHPGILISGPIVTRTRMV